jgi:hypothetical protein
LSNQEEEKGKGRYKSYKISTEAVIDQLERMNDERWGGEEGGREGVNQRVR